MHSRGVVFACGHPCLNCRSPKKRASLCHCHRICMASPGTRAMVRKAEEKEGAGSEEELEGCALLQRGLCQEEAETLGGDHLVVLVNGLFGSTLNWRNIVENVLPREDLRGSFQVIPLSPHGTFREGLWGSFQTVPLSPCGGDLGAPLSYFLGCLFTARPPASCGLFPHPPPVTHPGSGGGVHIRSVDPRRDLCWDRGVRAEAGGGDQGQSAGGPEAEEGVAGERDMIEVVPPMGVVLSKLFALNCCTCMKSCIRDSAAASSNLLVFFILCEFLPACEYVHLLRYPFRPQISHSMGGLIARHAAGLLYDPATGRIANLEPCHFVAMASPHLGVAEDGELSLPVLSWAEQLPGVKTLLRPVRKASRTIARAAIGRAGLEFLWADAGEAGERTACFLSPAA